MSSSTFDRPISPSNDPPSSWVKQDMSWSYASSLEPKARPLEGTTTRPLEEPTIRPLKEASFSTSGKPSSNWSSGEVFSTPSTSNGNAQGANYKVTLLREKLQSASHRCKAVLGLSSSEIGQRCLTVDTFFDVVAAERLRRMPCNGSGTDISLRWASRLAHAVNKLQQATTGFVFSADDAATFIWGCCSLLLERAIDNTTLAESIFCRFGRVTVGMFVALQYQNPLESLAELQRAIAGVYADLVDLICDVTVEFATWSRPNIGEFMGVKIDDAFFTYFKRFSTRLNEISVLSFQHNMQQEKSQLLCDVDLSSIRQFLEFHDRPLQLILESRIHSPIEGSFDWFKSHLNNFTITNQNVLLVTGGAGCGKSALAQWAVERFQLSIEYEAWTVVAHTIQPDLPAATSTMIILKDLLLQLLDRCGSSWKTQESILKTISDAVTGAANDASDAKIEDCLWDAMNVALTSNIQFMVIIDGLDHIKGGETTSTNFFERLEELFSKKTLSKLVVLSRSAPSRIRHGQIQQVLMQSQSDLHSTVDNWVKLCPQLAKIGRHQRISLVQAIVSRAQGSFVWAEMAFSYVKADYNFTEMISCVQSLPQLVSDLLEHHLRRLHLDSSEARYILSWLVASERPLLVKEIEQLLNVDPKELRITPWLASRTYVAFESLNHLVVVQDGIVRFRHSAVRDSIQCLANSNKRLSQPTLLPFTWQDAQLDLLMRLLAWVKISLTREVDVSLDKLPLVNQNRYFDAHILLEYAARYWLRHLVSSPLVTNGQVNLTSMFKNVLPQSVLFARLEVSGRETQFLQSFVESYQLAVEVRRIALGDKSKSLIQSLILSARISQKDQASHAVNHCYESWKLSREVLGQSSAIAVASAELLVQLTTGIFSQDTTAMQRKEEVLQYLLSIDWIQVKIQFSQVLNYLGILLELYRKRGDMQSVVTKISMNFYRRVVEKYGALTVQTAEAADFLMQHIQTSPTDEMTIELVQLKYQHMVQTMEPTDERRVRQSLYISQLYEERQDIQHTEEVLSSLWAALASSQVDSVTILDRKISVALFYYQFLRRQSHLETAESIIRELLSDIERIGIQSNQMLHQVQNLMVEIKNLQLYDLHKSVSILVWRYYKTTNQRYSTEAVSLAVSLVETMKQQATIENAHKLSNGDRELFIDLLDTVASSPIHLSVPIMKLCLTLVKIYIQEQNWSQAVACSWSVLRHVWPSVADSTSSQTFKPEMIPVIIDITLSLSQCYYRQFCIEKASTVYTNVFNISASADSLGIETLVSNMNAVVDFYESTFQPVKALDLLHRMSDIIITRCGENDHYTIETLYHEADLAIHLEKREEAIASYQRIYTITLKENRIASGGRRAALSLIELNERNKHWQAALDIYRVLWSTIIDDKEIKQQDPVQLRDLFEKLYTGYSSVLQSHSTTVNYSERYNLALTYRRGCTKIYGTRDEKALHATLKFAEVCEGDESYIEEAVSVYNEILKTSEWVSPSQSSKPLHQMSHSLGIRVKHRLAHLYTRQKTNISEAGSLYYEEFELAKKQHGYFSNATISWLRRLSQFYSQQKSQVSIRRGTDILHSYVLDVIQAGDSQMVVEWAQKIAEIYKEFSYTKAAKSLIEEIRQQALSNSKTDHTKITSHQATIFVASFESAFTKRASYNEILKEVTNEIRLQSNFSQIVSSHDLIQSLAIGERIYRLQSGQNRFRAAEECRENLFKHFCSLLSVKQAGDTEAVRQFYGICLREILNDDPNIKIINATTTLIQDLCNQSRFKVAVGITDVLHSFLHLTEGLRDYESIVTTAKVSMYLNGYNTAKCQDSITQQSMEMKSKLLLEEVMKASQSIGIQFVDLPLAELNNLVTLLGNYELFEELEMILTDLWTSRIVQKTWNSDMVVWIGRRLVETRFCHGHVEAAIRLCSDICYNLRHVWGSCDNVTLEMAKLLSGLYISSGNYHAATIVHETFLYDLLYDAEGVEKSQAIATAVQHIDLLSRAQSHLELQGSVEGEYAHISSELISRVSQKWGIQQDQLQQVSQASRGDSSVVWRRPRTFSLDVDEKMIHHNHLREAIRGPLPTGTSSGRRLSVEAL